MCVKYALCLHSNFNYELFTSENSERYLPLGVGDLSGVVESDESVNVLNLDAKVVGVVECSSNVDALGATHEMAKGGGRFERLTERCGRLCDQSRLDARRNARRSEYLRGDFVGGFRMSESRAGIDSPIDSLCSSSVHWM